MSQYTSDYPATPMPTGAPNEQQTAQVAREEAGATARSAADAGRQVAGSAAEQAKTVAQEATAQARDLVGEARGQLQQQARNGQQKATDTIRALVAELRELAEGGQQSGPVAEVARQIADRGDQAADWLGEREPGDLLGEVRAFARRRPGVFLAGAALAGVVVGRLTRGAVDAARGPSSLSPGPGPLPARPYEMPGYLVGQPGPGPYDSPAVTPSLPGAATPATAAPRPYAAPVDPHAAAAAGDPLGAPTPTVPVGGYAEPHHSSGSQYGTASQDSIDPLTQPGPGLSDPLDEPSRPGYEDRR